MIARITLINGKEIKVDLSKPKSVWLQNVNINEGYIYLQLTYEDFELTYRAKLITYHQ